MSLMSLDQGRSWRPMPAGCPAGNEIVVLPGADGGATNGTYITLPYTVTVDNATNVTATSVGHVARIDVSGACTFDPAHDFRAAWTVPPGAGVQWPWKLVHSGTVVTLGDGSLLTTMYGHGAGDYRSWTAHSATYFVRSVDGGRSWSMTSLIPWQPAYGVHADGPAEPNTVRLADGSLWCVFRSDATQLFWSARSTDSGRTWTDVRPLNFSWSVRPQLRVTSSGLIVLTGGRPGLFLWASADHGASWTELNVAAEHNRLVADPALQYDRQVVDASGPHFPRPSPEPEATAYMGLVEASDGAVVLSYDRLANGWKDRVWAANGTLLPGCWGDADRIFTMRIHLRAQ